MAANIQFIGDFHAFDTKRYDIRVFVEGGTAAITRITFGPDPLILGTSREHDWLVPVRGGTGYLSVACDFDTANRLAATSPTSHRVEIHNQDGDIVWVGFIQPQTFTDDLLIGITTVRNFPIVDCVGVLEQLTYGFTMVADIKSIIASAFGRTGLTNLTFYFPGNISRNGSDNEEKFPELCSKLSMLDTLKVGETIREFPPNSYKMKTLFGSTTAKEVIERICRFFGWTCSTDGLNVYFRSTSADDNSKTMYGFTQSEIGNHTQFLNTSPIVANDSVVLDGDYVVQPTSSSLDMERTLPASEVEISADFAAEENVLNPDLTTMSYPEIMDLGYCEAVTPTDYILEQETAARTLIQHGLSDGFATLSYDGAAPVGGQVSPPPSGKKYYPLIKPFLRIFDEFTADELPTKSKFDWSSSLNVCDRFKCYNDQGALLTLQSEVAYNFAEGALTIVGRWVSYSGQKYSVSNRFVRISVGNKYWDGSAWGDTPANIRFYVGDKNSPNNIVYEGSIPPTYNVLSNYPNTDGYTMPITSPISGIIKLQFLINEWDQEIGWMADDVNFTELRIIATPPAGGEIPTPVYGTSIVETGRDWELLEVNQYRRGLSAQGEAVKIELKFATHQKNDKFGSAFLYNRDGTYLTSLQYIDGDARPEEKLLAKYAALYAQPAEWRTLSIRFEDIGASTFNEMRQRVFYGNIVWDGSTWSIESAECNWRDHTIKIDIVKLPESLI